MGRTTNWAVLGVVACLSAAAACSDGTVVNDGPSSDGGSDAATGAGGDDPGDGLGGAGSLPLGQGVGQTCSTDEPCRDGLSCNSKDECEPSGDTPPGQACVISAECADGQCLARLCSAAGDGVSGGACSSDADCRAGLRCNLAGLSLVCAPEGDGDLGADCAASAECFGGLACVADQCAVPPPGLLPFGKPWEGVDCEPPVSADETVRAYFEVPGAKDAQEGDFFRLPFPNDIRMRGGKPDLSGFPTPGAALLGVDPVKLYVDAVSENDSGWGTYPNVIFRFSGTFDFDSFSDDAVHFHDITDPLVTNKKLGWRRFYTTGRSNYVCENFVGVQPQFGKPLEPGRTYAVWIDDLLQGQNGPIERSENLSAVLGSATPADAKLKAAHAAYALFRDHLEALELTPESVLTAAVFTVGPVRDPMAELAVAVAAAEPPVASDWVKCGGVAESPCAQAEGDRACGAEAADFEEYHALLSLPVFQQGTAPYLSPADGGGIDTSAPSTEEVCLSITVPKGEAPALGFPAVVFAHGTGGSFRSHVRDEVAGVLARSTPKFAVIGIDQVSHGPRRGDSSESPDNLFFNFLNPAAARGNPLQGAADQLSVARFAQGLNVLAADTGGADIKLDAAKLFFFGHSQGSTQGSLMLPYGDAFKAAVLSGNGASLKDALRTKSKPVDIAGVLPFALQDPYMSDLGVTLTHPVLSLLQQWIDPADPLNFAGIVGQPLAGHTGKHVFQTFGVDDSYSPPVTMATYAAAADLGQVTAHSSANPVYVGEAGDLNDPKPVGLTANVDDLFTLGLRQYGAPKNSDGHFVVFDVKAANDDMVLFFRGAAGVSPPLIGQ